MKDPKESCAGKVANCSERSLQFRSPEVGVAVEIMRDQMIDRFGLFRGPLFHSRNHAARSKLGKRCPSIGKMMGGGKAARLWI